MWTRADTQARPSAHIYAFVSFRFLVNFMVGLVATGRSSVWLGVGAQGFAFEWCRSWCGGSKRCVGRGADGAGAWGVGSRGRRDRGCRDRGWSGSRVARGAGGVGIEGCRGRGCAGSEVREGRGCAGSEGREGRGCAGSGGPRVEGAQGLTVARVEGAQGLKIARVWDEGLAGRRVQGLGTGPGSVGCRVRGAQGSGLRE